MDGNVLVRAGSACERITLKSDCKKAAESLKAAGELPFLDLGEDGKTWENGKNWADEEVDNWPPYCYLWAGKRVYFNTLASGKRDCDSKASTCICRWPTGN